MARPVRGGHQIALPPAELALHWFGRVAGTTSPPTSDTGLCRCGREPRLLNGEASDTAKCPGCGYVSDLCRCEPIT